MGNKYTFIDLFAGAGGLAEGFLREGFEPICHIEMNKDACLSLQTRLSYYWLKDNNKLDTYYSYCRKEITRDSFYSCVPSSVLDSVLNVAISENNLDSVFSIVDKKMKQKKANSIDVVVGGPPCQAYSLAGRSSKRINPLSEDSRNNLYKLYIRFISKYSPKVFVFENVVGLLSANGGAYFSDFINTAKTEGYNVRYKVLNAKDYGVLQNRRRVVVIGTKCESDLNLIFPDKVDSRQFRVGDILFDLPEPTVNSDNCFYIDSPSPYLRKFNIREPHDVLTLHSRRPINQRDANIYRTAIEMWNNKKERLNYKNLPTELKNHKNQESFLDRFKVVAPDLHESQTMLAHIAKDGHYFIHPDVNQIRSISVREAARIQSFPDSYYFEGSRSAAFVQIGNAVPPLMSYQIAKKIKSFLRSRY